MSQRLRRLLALAIGAVTALAIGPALAVPAGADESNHRGGRPLSSIKHIVIIYEENHSFDNLYGLWPGVNGLASADPSHTIQKGQSGVAYQCLLQDDVNLASPPLVASCTDTTTPTTFNSHFGNAPFQIDAYIKATDTTCPPQGMEFARANGWANGTGTTGGCTRDIVHKFYQEQFQINGGQQNRYVTGSDAVGLTMGYYDTKALPIYAYLTGEDHPSYAIADNFFQGAFGGSFLNHQWLIAAQPPTYPNAAPNLHSVLDAAGFPNATYPLYHPATLVRDGVLTQVCLGVVGLACGDYAVNTMQPASQPRGSFGAVLPLQNGLTVGDELTAKGVSWAWYSGGWSNAAGEVGAPGWTNGNGSKCSDPRSFANPAFPYCPDTSFQFHHQPFNYFANYAPGTPGRSHLQDEQAFIDLTAASEDTCKLNSVSFVKPIGEQNEHPGYASEAAGSTHLVTLLKDIENSACAKSTMVVATYDEFGGSWDHVTPPGQGGKPGPHDVWGPGTRIPALIIAPHLRDNFVVDHTQYDTTSILATIEHRWQLNSLGARDKLVNDLANVFRAKSPSGADQQQD